MPFALDNGAFIAWEKNQPWNVEAWKTMLQYIGMTGLVPLWAAVPDVVANRDATLANWPIYSPEIKRRGWNAAFCVQDGMTYKDVPKDADVVFVGGTDAFKLPNLKMFTEHFPRVHCARINSVRVIEKCEKLGCESVDGTGWFRDPSRQDKLPAIERFIEGWRRPKEPELFDLL